MIIRDYAERVGYTGDDLTEAIAYIKKSVTVVPDMQNLTTATKTETDTGIDLDTMDRKSLVSFFKELKLAFDEVNKLKAESVSISNEYTTLVTGGRMEAVLEGRKHSALTIAFIPIGYILGGVIGWILGITIHPAVCGIWIIINAILTPVLAFKIGGKGASKKSNWEVKKIEDTQKKYEQRKADNIKEAVLYIEDRAHKDHLENMATANALASVATLEANVETMKAARATSRSMEKLLTIQE